MIQTGVGNSSGFSLWYQTLVTPIQTYFREGRRIREVVGASSDFCADRMFEALGFAVSRGSTCAMVPELKSRNALEDGNYSLRAAKIGVPRCSGTGVCSCVLPTPPTMQGKVASLAQVFCLFSVCLIYNSCK